MGVTTAAFASARKLELRLPTRAAAGDLLVAVLTIRAGDGARIWRPPGWTPVRRDSCRAPGGVALTQALYVRVAGARQAAVSAWGVRHATSAVGGVVAYRGVDTRSPVAGARGAVRHDAAAILAPSVAVRLPRTLVVTVFGHTGTQQMRQPPGTARRLDVATRRTPRGASAKLVDFVLARAAATGPRRVRLAARAACTVGQQLALNPAFVAVFPRPASTEAPRITGTPAVGQQLSATPGTWSGSPTAFTYRWRRCNAAGEACSDIADAASAGYVVASADARHRLRVAVTATNPGGAATAVSAPTDVVATSAPPPPAPPPVPGPPPLPLPSGSVVLVDRTWTCRGPVNIPLVRVTMRADADAIHLREDCSGRIGRIEIETWTQDGVKVNAPAPAAHDLVIESGYIRCHARSPRAHQDGIQAMGGARVRFVGLELNCNSNPNAQLFISAANGGTPTDIVCERCLFGSGAGSSLFIASSTRSGARNSLICPGRFSPVRIQGATAPVNESNTVLPASDPRC